MSGFSDGLHFWFLKSVTPLFTLPVRIVPFFTIESFFRFPVTSLYSGLIWRFRRNATSPLQTAFRAIPLPFFPIP